MFQRLFDEGFISFYFNAYKCWQYNKTKQNKKEKKTENIVFYCPETNGKQFYKNTRNKKRE